MLASSAPGPPARASLAGSRQVFSTAAEALRTLLPRADEIYEVRRVLRPEELRALEKRLRRRLPEGGYVLFAGLRGGRIDALAFVTSEIGRSEPFTFMVAVEPDGAVRDVVVLTYRESRGSQVRHTRFLRQLRGKDLNDPIRIGRDVAAVSGATLSCHALAAGVRKILTAASMLYLSRPEAEVVSEIRARGRPYPPPGGTGSASPASRGKARAPRPPVRLEREHYVMGTTCRITLFAPDRARGAEAARLAFEEIRRVDAMLSDFHPDSEISHLSAAAGSGPHPVSPELYRLLRGLAPYQEESGGAFDPTVRPLLFLWGLRGAPSSRDAPPPSDAERRAALDRVGYARIRFDDQARTVELPLPGMSLDPGAFGKGYAVDRAVALLVGLGIRSALVDFGSTAFALGAPPGESGWSIEVRAPGRGACGPAPPRLTLSGQAISTSGDGDKTIVLGGRRRSHILDPRTGLPVRTALSSVTVIAPDALAADIRSTAAFVLGPEAGRAYLEHHGCRGLFLMRPGPPPPR